MADPAANPAAAPALDDGPVVVASDLTKRYGEGDAAVQALRGVDLSVARGEFVAIMGPSGSGKSTLLHLLGGLDTPTSGDVRIGGDEPRRARDDELLAFAPRPHRLHLPVLQPAAHADRRGERRPPAAARRGAPSGAEQRSSAARAGGAGRRRGHLPHELSGGEQQRVAVARAL